MPAHERMFHHRHAHRLDDPERRTWLPPEDVVRRLELRPGMHVADVGAGTGYFAFPLARAIAPGGEVLAVDLQPEMLAELRGRVPAELPIRLVEGEAARTTLPTASVDLAFYANVWHEIDDRTAALHEAARILRPGGRIAILDWRHDVGAEPGPPLHHRISAEDVVGTLTSKGWRVDLLDHAGAFSYLVIAERD